MADVEWTKDTRKADELSRNADGNALRCIKKIAFDVVAYMQSHMVPSVGPAGGFPGIDTGNLKNAIHAEQTGPAEMTVYDGATYGIHLEFGTVNMAARPFFMPSLDAVLPTIPEQMGAYISGGGG